MNGLGPVRHALTRVRDELSPTLDDKARLRARILAPAGVLGRENAGPEATTPAAVDPSAAAQVAARAASLTPWAALKAAGAAGAAVGLALLGTAGGVGFWLGHASASRAASVRAASTVAAVVSTPPAEAAPVLERAASAPPANAPEPAPSHSSVHVAAAPVAAGDRARGPSAPRTDVPARAHAAHRRAQTNPINDELALLRRVERALRNNEPALARALLVELDERFPASRLGEERSAARCIADCRSGEPGANERARTFLREHGASVYRKRIALACELDAEPRDKSGEAAPMTNAGSADTHVW